MVKVSATGEYSHCFWFVSRVCAQFHTYMMAFNIHMGQGMQLFVVVYALT
jgi:hypothetical protein